MSSQRSSQGNSQTQQYSQTDDEIPSKRKIIKKKFEGYLEFSDPEEEEQEDEEDYEKEEVEKDETSLTDFGNGKFSNELKKTMEAKIASKKINPKGEKSWYRFFKIALKRELDFDSPAAIEEYIEKNYKDSAQVVFQKFKYYYEITKGIQSEEYQKLFKLGGNYIDAYAKRVDEREDPKFPVGEFRTITKRIPDIQDRLLLSILLDPDGDLGRNDYGNMKFSDFDPKKYTLTVPVTNKTQREVVMDWSRHSRLIQRFLKERIDSPYFFYFGTAEGRSEAFSRHLRKITKNYFGKVLTINDFRHIRGKSNAELFKNDLSVLKLPLKQAIENWKKRAQKLDHSFDTESTHYIDKSVSAPEDQTQKITKLEKLLKEERQKTKDLESQLAKFQKKS